MKYFILIFMSLILFACQPKKSPEILEEEKLVEDIHRLHDVETMPKMGHLVKLGKQLDSLEGTDSTIIIGLKKDLVNADDAMMDWMVQFNWQDEPTPVDKRVEYYKKEVVKLEEMKTLINNAIDAAETQLEK